MNSAVRRRAAMTLVETMIAVLVGFTVMMVTFTLFRSTSQLRDKTSQMNAATQAAAQFFYALENDVANIKPQDDPEDTFSVIDWRIDPNFTAGVAQLELNRTSPVKGQRMEWDKFDYLNANRKNVKVTYTARQDNNGLFTLSRTMEDDTGTPLTEVFFRGAYARDVRFGVIKQPRVSGSGDDWFLRVSLLMVGDVVNEKLQSVNQAPELLLTTVYRIPVAPPATPVDPLL